MATRPNTRRYVAWALILLGLALITLWAFRLGRTALSLRGHWVEAQSWAEAPGEVDPAQACRLVQDAQADVSAVQRQVGLLARWAPAAGWLPWVGGDLRAAPHLLTMGTNLAQAGAIVCEVAEPALPWLGGGSPATEGVPRDEILRLLDQGRSDLQRAEAAAGRARWAWEQVDAPALSAPLRERAPLLDQGLPLVEGGLSAAAVAPDLLGADGTRTYLILALNEDEVRPGGGFISGVGEVRVAAGEVVSMTFRDSYAVDDFSEPYPPAPEPMQRYMGIELWVFRDSNWSPDFPTAARQAMALYRPGYPVSIDGVVALDQRAVQALVAAVGPLSVDGAEQPITGETILAYMRQAWAPGEEDWDREWWRQRKSFMGAIAGAMRRRVENGEVDWVALGRAVLRLLEQKHLLVYVPEPTVQELLAEQGWDGGLRPGPGDFLAVIDANLGYNKASAQVEQRAAYQVDLTQDPPQATLTLTYTHTSQADVPCRPESRYAATYQGMMDRCYWDYLRVYVPRGSQLLEATRIPIPGAALWSGQRESGAVETQAASEAPCLSCEVMSVLPPASTQTRHFTWTLPEDVVRWDGQRGRYALRVHKQPGKEAHPLTVRVRLPQGAALAEAMPRPSATEQGWVTYHATLDRDLTFDLHFK